MTGKILCEEVKFSLPTAWRHTRIAEVQLHFFLPGHCMEMVEWSASRPGCFTPGKEPRYPLSC